MYREESESQIKLEDFDLPFGGPLDEKNRWVILSQKIPWDKIEDDYKAKLSGSNRGAPANSVRMALGALIIKEKLQISDRETVEQIRENPYLKYFIGMKGYREEAPFDSSMMVHFRKRLDGKRLFGEAEEREESDGGIMLNRVVLVQDKLLSLGVNSINEWLREAERP